MVMEGRASDPTRRGLLAVGVVIGIKQPQRFGGAFHQIAFVALERVHATDIYIAQIERFFAILHPLGQRHPGPTCRLDPDRIEPGSNPDIVHFGRKTQVIGIIRRKAFRTVEEGMDACAAQHRHTIHGRLQDRFEMVEILGKLVKLKIVRNWAPGF